MLCSHGADVCAGMVPVPCSLPARPFPRRSTPFPALFLAPGNQSAHGSRGQQLGGHWCAGFKDHWHHKQGGTLQQVWAWVCGWCGWVCVVFNVCSMRNEQEGKEGGSSRHGSEQTTWYLDTAACGDTRFVVCVCVCCSHLQLLRTMHPPPGGGCQIWLGVTPPSRFLVRHTRNTTRRYVC